MHQHDHKSSVTLQYIFRYGSTLLAICGLVILALATFLPADTTSLAPRSLAAPGGPGGKPTGTMPEPKPYGVEVIWPDASGEVQSLADVKDVPEVAPFRGEEEDTRLPKIPIAPLESEPDGALQAPLRGPSAPMPNPIANFEGLGLSDQSSSFSPPDTNGDIGYDPTTGKRYYFQWINVTYKAWDVTNPATPVVVVPTTQGNALWASALPGSQCATNNAGDPIVLFDEQAQRWFISQFSLGPSYTGPFHQCVAVSKTADPAGGWYVYDYVYRDGVTYLNDYPHFGVWPDATYNAYFMTVHQFNAAGTAWLGQAVAAFDRAKLLNGTAAPMVLFDLYSVNANFGGMLPADLDGLPPPAGTPGLFFEVDDSAYIGPSDAMRIWEFRPNWVTPAASTFGLSGQPNYTLAVSAFTLMDCGSGSMTCAAQSGTSQRLDTLADRLMHRVAFRYLSSSTTTTQTVVLNHTVEVGTNQAAIRWYEVRRDPGTGAWTIPQQSTYAPDSTHRWMGSIATDRAGNIALGYSASSSTSYPSIRYAGRLFTDTLNTLPQTEITTTTSTGSQTTSNRWGDYSTLGVDPQDGCTFWFTTEYHGASGLNWRSRIVSFKFPTCTPVPTGGLTGTVTNLNTSAPISGAAVSLVDAASNAWSATTNASGLYQFIGIPATTYTATASAVGYLPNTATGVSVSAGLTTTRNFALTPLAQADLAITKTASASAVGIGTALSYTLSIGNLGPDAITTTVAITDVLPAGVTLGSASGTGWVCSGTTTIVCTRASLAVGTAPAIVINVTAPASAGIITNTAMVASSVTDIVLSNNTSAVGVTVAPQTDLAITKAGPVTALVNSTLVYTLNVNNNGPLPIGVSVTQTYTNATAITINDNAAASLYPSNITVSGMPPLVKTTLRLIGFSHTYPRDVDLIVTSPAGAKSWIMSDPGGTATVSNINLVFDDAAAGNVSCTAGPTAGVYRPTGCTDTLGTDVFPAPAPAGPYTASFAQFNNTYANGTWSLYARDDYAGDSGSISGGWVLTLTGVYAGPVTVTDTLPAGTTFVGAAGSGWSCSQALGVVTCTRSTLAVGTAPSIVITATAPADAGVITNTAIVNSPWPDSTPGNNTASVATTLMAPIVYAHPSDPTCGGNTPCFLGATAIQQALNAVTANGQVVVLGSHTANATLTCTGNVTVSSASGATITWTGAAGDLFTAQNCNLVVKGLALNGGSTVTMFRQVGTGTLTAYANNITNFATAYTGSGTHNLGHNYWGAADPLAAPPTGFSTGEWAARLGAPIANWAEGSGSATLVTGGNTVALNGGSGTAVIVSHGRGLANAPFGNGVAPYVNQTCSDFYDLFTVNGGGTWTAQIPVDNAANCNANTLTPRRVAWITTLAQCSPATNGACWNALPLARVSVSGQNLLIANLTVAELGGTPFVAGDVNGADPTAVQLTRIEAHATSWTPLLAIAALAGLSAGLVLLRRRWA